MKRREVRWYEFQPPDKRRPVLILTRNSVLATLREVTIAPITSTIRSIPSEILLGPEDGMSEACVVNFDHIQTVPQKKIGQLITTLNAEKLEQVGSALDFALGVDEFQQTN